MSDEIDTKQTTPRQVYDAGRHPVIKGPKVTLTHLPWGKAKWEQELLLLSDHTRAHQ